MTGVQATSSVLFQTLSGFRYPTRPEGGKAMSKGNGESTAADRIVWPEPVHRLLADVKQWEHNCEMVRRFCSLGVVTRWAEGIDGYARMPVRYVIEEIEVEFLPHWGHMIIGGLYFDLPESPGEIKTTVKVVGLLKFLGWKGPR